MLTSLHLETILEIPLFCFAVVFFFGGGGEGWQSLTYLTEDFEITNFVHALIGVQRRQDKPYIEKWAVSLQQNCKCKGHLSCLIGMVLPVLCRRSIILLIDNRWRTSEQKWKRKFSKGSHLYIYDHIHVREHAYSASSCSHQLQLLGDCIFMM